jgi:glutathione S-transferase
MRLFDFHRAPNPRRARMFLAEKGLDVQLIPVNLFGMEQLSPEFLAINPDGTVPLLETDEGVFLSETVAICHYLEQLQPEPALMGKTALEQAQVLMWNNIVEQQGMFAIAETLRNWSPGFKNRVFAGKVDYPQMPELIARGRNRMEQFFDRVNAQLTGRAFLATEDYTLADISLLAMTEFASWVECEPTASRGELARWHAKVTQRPSANA